MTLVLIAKGPCFGRLTFKTRGQLGSRYRFLYSIKYIYIYTLLGTNKSPFKCTELMSFPFPGGICNRSLEGEVTYKLEPTNSQSLQLQTVKIVADFYFFGGIEDEILGFGKFGISKTLPETFD